MAKAIYFTLQNQISYFHHGLLGANEGEVMSRSNQLSGHHKAFATKKLLVSRTVERAIKNCLGGLFSEA
jgi:hypothetical protein